MTNCRRVAGIAEKPRRSLKFMKQLQCIMEVGVVVTCQRGCNAARTRRGTCLVTRTCIGAREAARKCRGSFFSSRVFNVEVWQVSPHLGHVSPVSRYTCCGSRLPPVSLAMLSRKERCRLFFLSFHLAITAPTSPAELRYVMLYRTGRR